eukprot:384130_1
MSGLYISDDEAQELLIKNDSKAIEIVSYQNELNELKETNTTNNEIILNIDKNINQIESHNKNINNISNNINESSTYRWFVLIILCIQSISIWYCFDILSILHNEFYDQFKLTNFEYNLLYVFAVFPSLILSIFASYIIDKYG